MDRNESFGVCLSLSLIFFYILFHRTTMPCLFFLNDSRVFLSRADLNCHIYRLQGENGSGGCGDVGSAAVGPGPPHQPSRPHRCTTVWYSVTARLSTRPAPLGPGPAVSPARPTCTTAAHQPVGSRWCREQTALRCECQRRNDRPQQRAIP